MGLVISDACGLAGLVIATPPTIAYYLYSHSEKKGELVDELKNNYSLVLSYLKENPSELPGYIKKVRKDLEVDLYNAGAKKNRVQRLLDDLNDANKKPEAKKGD